MSHATAQKSNSQYREEATMSKKATTTAKANIYQIVTERIIASLRAGIIPWEKPWQAPHFSGSPFPRNFRRGKPYRGVNVFLLWASPYSYPFWLTFKTSEGVERFREKGRERHANCLLQKAP